MNKIKFSHKYAKMPPEDNTLERLQKLKICPSFSVCKQECMHKEPHTDNAMCLDDCCYSIGHNNETCIDMPIYNTGINQLREQINGLKAIIMELRTTINQHIKGFPDHVEE